MSNFGTHSLSLAVKDIKASKTFYEKLGFEALSEFGSVEDKWLIMQKAPLRLGYFRICLKKILSLLTQQMPETSTKN